MSQCVLSSPLSKREIYELPHNSMSITPVASWHISPGFREEFCLAREEGWEFKFRTWVNVEEDLAVGRFSRDRNEKIRTVKIAVELNRNPKLCGTRRASSTPSLQDCPSHFSCRPVPSGWFHQKPALPTAWSATPLPRDSFASYKSDFSPYMGINAELVLDLALKGLYCAEVSAGAVRSNPLAHVSS